MLEISVSSDFRQVERMLSDLQKKQLPFATAQALNDTAFDAQKAVKAQAEKSLDRPTKFTLGGFRVDKARKRHLVSTVFIEDNRWRYLRDIVQGTTKLHGRRGFAIPVNAKLNKHGNIPGRKLIKNKKQYIDTVNGVTGVFERRGRGGKQIKLLIVFKKKVTHKKRLPFGAIVAGVAANKFKRHFDRRLSQALMTAF